MYCVVLNDRLIPFNTYKDALYYKNSLGKLGSYSIIQKYTKSEYELFKQLDEDEYEHCKYYDDLVNSGKIEIIKSLYGLKST